MPGTEESYEWGPEPRFFFIRTGVFPFGEFISISITDHVQPGSIVASVAASVSDEQS